MLLVLPVPPEGELAAAEFDAEVAESVCDRCDAGARLADAAALEARLLLTLPVALDLSALAPLEWTIKKLKQKTMITNKGAPITNLRIPSLLLVCVCNALVLK